MVVSNNIHAIQIQMISNVENCFGEHLEMKSEDSLLMYGNFSEKMEHKKAGFSVNSQSLRVYNFDLFFRAILVDHGLPAKKKVDILY